MKKCVPFLLLLCSAITSTGAQGILSDESDTPQTVFIHGKPDILNQATRLKDSMQNGLPHLCQMPDKYFNKVSAKAHKLTQRLTKRTKKALHRLQKQEEKINSKLSKITGQGTKDIPFWRDFAQQKGRFLQFINNRTNPQSYQQLTSALSLGKRVILSTYNHQVIASSIVERTITKLSGKVITRFILNASNPAVGRYTTINLKEIFNIFYIW